MKMALESIRLCTSFDAKSVTGSVICPVSVLIKLCAIGVEGVTAQEYLRRSFSTSSSVLPIMVSATTMNDLRNEKNQSVSSNG